MGNRKEGERKEKSERSIKGEGKRGEEKKVLLLTQVTQRGLGKCIHCRRARATR